MNILTHQDDFTSPIQEASLISFNTVLGQLRKCSTVIAARRRGSELGAMPDLQNIAHAHICLPLVSGVLILNTVLFLSGKSQRVAHALNCIEQRQYNTSTCAEYSFTLHVRVLRVHLDSQISAIHRDRLPSERFVSTWSGPKTSALSRAASAIVSTASFLRPTAQSVWAKLFHAVSVSG
jgi:hypothetical protein